MEFYIINEDSIFERYDMNHEEEILQLLREIKDVQQQHHTEWKNTVKMAEKQ